MIKACLCLKHSFFPSSTREKGPFLPSRNNCSIQCIGFRVCPLGFFLKPCSIYHSLLYRHRSFNFLFPLASFRRVGANFRLFLLPLKAALRPCLPCHHPIAPALITLFAVSITSLSYFSSMQVGPCLPPHWDYCTVAIAVAFTDSHISIQWFLCGPLIICTLCSKRHLFFK